MSHQSFSCLLVAGVEEAGDEPPEGRGPSPLDLQQEVEQGIAVLLLQQGQLSLRQKTLLQDLRPQSLVVNSLAEEGEVVGDFLFVFLLHLTWQRSCLVRLQVTRHHIMTPSPHRPPGNSNGEI